VEHLQEVRRRKQPCSESDLDASSAEANRGIKHKKQRACNKQQSENLEESNRSKRADQSSDVDRSWQKTAGNHMVMLKGLRGIGKSGAHMTMQGNSTGKDTRVKKFH
jgi:hypothetical protein